jgi:hypothetical protein
MHSLKNGGDNIAREFLRLTKKSAVIEKKASDASEVTDEDIASLVVDNSEDPAANDSTSAAIDSEINDMENYAEDANSESDYVLAGLSDIADGLRKKGENFAADVVEATAKGIRSDISSQEVNAEGIIKSLSKMAEGLSSEGDRFAADMILATVNKITN